MKIYKSSPNSKVYSDGRVVIGVSQTGRNAFSNPLFDVHVFNTPRPLTNTFVGMNSDTEYQFILWVFEHIYKDLSVFGFEEGYVLPRVLGLRYWHELNENDEKGKRW